jgi:hypothetical protein
VSGASVRSCATHPTDAESVCLVACDAPGACRQGLTCHEGVCGAPPAVISDASRGGTDTEAGRAAFPGSCLVDGKLWADGAVFWRICDAFCVCEDGSPACDASVCNPCSVVDAGARGESFCDVGPECTATTGYWVSWMDTMYPEQPVCGCDGVTYQNGNVAMAAQVSIARPGACDAEISCWMGQILEVEGRGTCLCTGSELTECTGEASAAEP